MDFVYSAQWGNWLKRIPGPVLAPWLQKLLGLLLIWQLARLTWLLWPVPTLVALPAVGVSGSVSEKAVDKVDLSNLIRLSLFGDQSAKPVEQVQPLAVDVPETSLNIKLRGILHSPVAAKASVVIEGENGTQQAYFLGDSLQSPTGVLVKEIQADRVILDRSGRLETLKLNTDRLNTASPDAATAAPASAAKAAGPAASATKAAGNTVDDRRHDPDAVRLLQDYRNKLISSPISLAELVRASPVMENGSITGYRVRPNKDAFAFRTFGLRRNDIVTAVNGTPLGDTSAALGLLSSLSTAQDLTLQVKRGDQKLDILLKMAP